MVTHADRLQAARDTVNFICSRSAEEMQIPVPNCPPWTVYNAAVHIGKVGIAWQSMSEATPDDPESRTRGYADAEARGSGHDPATLGSWALAAIDSLDDDLDRACYFSMTGGHGTVALWGWHAASELAVHRLDVEAALGMEPTISQPMAIDALTYAAQYFLPAMSRVTETNPGNFDLVATCDDATAITIPVQAHGAAGEDPQATLTGTPVDLLLAVWGRPHGAVEITGAADVVDAWFQLPSQAFQLGTWD